MYVCRVFGQEKGGKVKEEEAGEDRSTKVHSWALFALVDAGFNNV